MGKTMAHIEKGIVTNIAWYSVDEPETDTLKNINDRPVGIGDTYDNGKWFRDGVEILTSMEELQKKLDDAETALSILGVTE